MTEFVHLDDVELAWAAGFFDGEGCVHLSRTNGISRKIYPSLEISQADPEVLERFKKAVGGLGKINGPYAYSGRKDMWYYSCRAANEVRAVAIMIRPYLSSIKANQIDNMLPLLDSIRKYSKRLTSEEIDQVMIDYHNGITYKEIALKFDRDYEAIVKLISSRRIRD